MNRLQFEIFKNQRKQSGDASPGNKSLQPGSSNSSTKQRSLFYGKAKYFKMGPKKSVFSKNYYTPLDLEKNVIGVEKFKLNKAEFEVKEN